MKTLKMVFISILLVISGATSANAMGDREQGALIGAGALLILGNLLGSNQPTRYVESPVYYEPRPTVVYTQPYYAPSRVIYVDPPRHRHPHHHYREYRYDGYR